MNEKQKRIFLVSVGIAVIIICLIYYVNVKSQRLIVNIDEPLKASGFVNIEKNNNAPASTEMETYDEKAIVYITGEVKSPGVYEIDKGSRVMDVLQLAGGPTEKANLRKINLAKIVLDEEQIDIPKIVEVVDKSGNIIQNDNNNVALININTASLEVLKTLPGIGNVTANKIIGYRTDNEGFSSVGELLNIPGFSKKTFENIKELITVE